MKHCAHCGKELLDEAVVCVGCGCPVNSKETENPQKKSTSKTNKKVWMIVLSVLFVVSVLVIVLIFTSSDFIRTKDTYDYLHSDFGTMSIRGGSERAIEWQSKVDAVKSELITYYIGAGVCGVLALTSLVGNILLFTKKSKKQQ